MKIIITRTLAVFIAILILQLQVMAEISAPNNTVNAPSNSSEEIEIYESFNPINDLVSYLNTNNATYSDVENYNSSLISNVSSTAALALNNTNDGEPPILSAFWWGCIFGWAGILIVYITTDKDKTLTNKALSGCFVNGGVGLVSYVVFLIWYLSYFELI